MILVALAVALALGLPRESAAHRLNVFAWVEGAEVAGEAYFSGGGKAGNIRIEALADGSRVAETRTDSEGSFRMALPGVGGLSIIAHGDDGHRAEFPLTAPEAPVAVQPAPVGTTETGPADAWAGIEQRLEATLERNLAPIRRDLAALGRQRSTARDALAGVGFILGVFGAAALAWSRKTNPRPDESKPTARSLDS